jgi:hypothetical protein
MREYVPHRSEHRQAPAARSARPDDARAIALRVQGAVGNRAMARLPQRVRVTDFVQPGIPDVLFELTLWDQFVALNRSQAEVVGIPSEWRDLAGEYAGEFPEDGRWIKAGVLRKPRFWLGGGLVARAGPETHAITLDRDVFFNPETEGEPHVDTYVHELVHVAQYGDLGVPGFLGTYLAEFLTHLAEGKLTGDDTKAYHDIVHERHAAGIEKRFQTWREKKEADKKAEDAKKPRTPSPDEEVEAMRRPRPIAATGRIAISASVGANAENRPGDVKRVAARLHALGFLSSATTDVATVTDAIERYQRGVLNWRSSRRAFGATPLTKRPPYQHCVSLAARWEWP